MVRIHRDVVEQHALAASILWLQRDLAVAAPHYRLDDLTKLDGQLEANLDGLSIAARAESLDGLDELRWREAGEIFVSASLALGTEDDSKLDDVLQAVGDSHELQRAFVSALGWSPYPCARRVMDRLWNSGDPLRRYLALAGHAVHRIDRPGMLTAAIESNCPQLRQRAARTAGELGRVDLLPELQAAIKSESATCRDEQACSILLLAHDEHALAMLQAVVEDQEDPSRRVLQLIISRLPLASAIRWLGSLSAAPGSQRKAVIAAGLAGGVDLVAWLLDSMEIPQQARVAGEALSMITGVDLADQDLEGNGPDGFDAGPNDDPADENVQLDPDENLPWPNVQKIQQWWMRHRSDFQPNQRYLCGRPISDDALEHVLREGYQRQRSAAALGLAMRRPGKPLFNVRAPGHRQQRWLGLR